MHKLETWLIWPDCHIPFEDKRAFDLVLRVSKTLRPFGQVVIGDFADMLTVSRHPKTPRQHRWQLKEEVEAVNKRLDQLDALGCKKKIWTLGNHDINGQKLAMRDASVLGLYDSLDPCELFHTRARGWRVLEYQEPVKVGKVWFVHDTDYCGPDAAKQNGAMFSRSTVQGHVHSAQVRYFGDVFGEQHVSATLGWLGDMRMAKYMATIKRRVNWMHSFGVMRVEPGGNSHVQVIPIVAGRCVVDGRLYTQVAS